MKVLLSFDTEDFVTPEADDAVLYYARTLSERGIRGTFFVVAERVRVLKQRGRVDVLREMARHDIGYHTNTHSLRPTINEYQEPLPWHEAVAALVERERDGLRLVAETFQRPIVSICPPGTSWSAPMLAAFRQLGIRVCAGAMLDGGDGQPAWFAGVINLCYDQEHLVDPFLTPAVADQATRQIQQLQSQRQQGNGYLAVFTHPTRLVTDEFWDTVNLADDRLSTGIALQPAPVKSPSETAAIKRKFESALDVFQRGRTSFSTYSDLNDEITEREDGPVTPEAISALAARILDRFDYHDIDGRVFSPAEAFVILGRAARDLVHSGRLREQPPPDVIGPTQAIPDADNRREVRVDHLKRTLNQAFHEREVHDVPIQIKVHTTMAAPQWFLAANAALIRSGDGSIETITVPRLSEYPAVANTDAFCDFRYRGTWPILPHDFEGRNLIELNRLQCWSYKPCRAP